MRTAGTAFLALFLLVASGAGAGESVDAKVGEAQALYRAGRYEEALEVWEGILETHAQDPVVTEGTAHWQASLCLRQLGSYAEAVLLLEGYLKDHPRGEGVYGALAGIFHAHAESGDERRAQQAGKRVLRAFPEAKGTYWILRVYFERGWTVPRLSTSFDVLYRWAFDRTNGKEAPDIRLGFLDLIAAWHKREKIVKSGAILYCRAWCLHHAGRHDEAIALCRTHLRAYPRASERDKVRRLLAESFLAKSPPEVDAAREVLEDLLRADSERYKPIAEKMLAAAETGGASIQIDEGCPRPEGLGKTVLLTNLRGGARLRALGPWIEARGAEVVRFRGDEVGTSARELARIGPEFVAVAVDPETVDINFQLAMLELCRGLDEDPVPDFHYGYLVARDAKDLGALAGRILAKEKDAARGTAGAIAGVPESPAAVSHLDAFLHFGHGTPRRIVGGLSAPDLRAGTLPRGPVVVSGACFNGVLSRSYASSLLQPSYLRPESIPPEETIALGWIHAGATGVIAALEGDRGEMAGAEWEHFRETAPALGALAGYEYRLIFATLPETYGGFPRFAPGKAKRTGFFDVMLRGMASRILIGDPAYRPFPRPVSSPSIRATARRDGNVVRVEIEVLKGNVMLFTNTLPRTAGIPFRERRLYARVALPEGFTGRLGRPEVNAPKDARVEVRHEIWGGRRYVNVLSASTSSRLGKTGARVTLEFPVEE